MTAIAKDVYFDTGRWFGSGEPGSAIDIRPGAPSAGLKVTHDGTYAWPVATGPKPITLQPSLLDTDWGINPATLGLDPSAYENSPYGRETLDRFNIVGGSWNQYGRLHAQDYVWETTTQSAEVSSVKSYEPNTAYYFHILPYTPQGQGNLILRASFGSPVASQRLHLNVWDDGKGYLARGDGINPEDQLGTGYLLPAQGGNVGGIGWTKIVVFFHSDKKISVLSNRGKGFTIDVPGLEWQEPGTIPLYVADPTTVSWEPVFKINAPEITPAGKLDILLGPKSLLQAGPVKYKGEPLAYLPAGTEGYPKGGSITIQPNSGRPLIENLVGLAIMTIAINQRVKKVSAATVYVKIPNSGDKGLKAALTKDPADDTHSPQLLRTEVATPSTTGTSTGTNDSTLSKDLISFSHNHSKDGITGEMTFRYAENYPTYRRLFNIPFQYKENGNVYLEGVIQSPTFKPVSPTSQELSFSFTDETRWLKNTLVASISRFDGFYLDDAVKDILIGAGFPIDGSKWDIDTTTATTDGRKGNKLSKGEGDEKPTNAADAIKSAYDWINYLVDTYTSAEKYPYVWVWGFQHYLNPGVGLEGTGAYETRFFLKNPDLFSDTPVATFFGNRAWAVTLGSVSHSTAYNYTFDTWNEVITEPECNYLIVSGWKTVSGEGDEANEDAGEPVTAVKKDADSANPALAVDLRKANWLGERRHVIVIDSSLNSQKDVDGACAKLFPRLSTAKVRAQMTGEWNPTIKLWDMVRVYHKVGTSHDELGTTAGGDGTNVAYNDWRVVGYNVQHIQDTRTPNTPVWLHRPATYTLERTII